MRLQLMSTLTTGAALLCVYYGVVAVWILIGVASKRSALQAATQERAQLVEKEL
jgi:hypothetical protein